MLKQTFIYIFASAIMPTIMSGRSRIQEKQIITKKLKPIETSFTSQKN